MTVTGRPFSALGTQKRVGSGGKKQQISVRVMPSTYRQLRAFALKYGVSMGRAADMLIEKGAQHYGA